MLDVGDCPEILAAVCIASRAKNVSASHASNNLRHLSIMNVQM